MGNVGNDIVDIKLAESQTNWMRKGFLEKQFTPKEIHSILMHERPFLQVLLYWSMKEAAYKCYTQKVEKRFFAPKKFVSKMVTKRTGAVSIDNYTYFTSSKITSAYIHTIASNNTLDNVKFAICSLEKGTNSSEFLNAKILANFSKKSFIKKSTLGVPKLYLASTENTISISKSHHGNFAAYAILKGNYAS